MMCLKKRYVVSVFGILALCAMIGWFYYQPYRILGLVRQAAARGDPEALRDYIDFDSLRESFKENVIIAAMEALPKREHGDPFAGVGMALGAKLFDPIINSYISPQGIMALLTRGTLAESRGGEKNEPEMGYDSFTMFSVRYGITSNHKDDLVFYMRPRGISWKIVAVKLPFPDMQNAIQAQNPPETTPQNSDKGLQIRDDFDRSNLLGYTAYTNRRFGFKIDFPSSFTVKEVPDNGDGVNLDSSDGKAHLMVAGGNNNGATLEEYFEGAIKRIKGTIVYKTMKDNWAVISWKEGGDIYYSKIFSGSRSNNSFIFYYPENQKEIYDQVLMNILKSFRPGQLDEAG
jgi:hypothetical protein